MLKLNLGCGTNILSGWENHDADVDLRQPLPWADVSADYILLEHVLEHFNSAAGYSILEECWRVLKPGGVLRVCVPDVSRVARGDDEYAKFVAAQGWGSNPVKVIAQCHGHEMLWTFDALAAVLGSIGFQPERAQPRLSMHRELCNVEGHHRVVGVKFNDIETLVVEGAKPGAPQAKSVSQPDAQAGQSIAQSSGSAPQSGEATPPVFAPANTIRPAATGGRALASGIVIACDGDYFPFARGLIDSIAANRPDNSIGLRVLDLGLSDSQRDELRAGGAKIVEAKWDIDFAACASAPSSYRAFTAQPFLPRYFPDLELLIWLDADTWLQDWRAIDLLSRGAADGALAIVPELHRAFSHLYQPVNAVRLAMRKSYASAFNEELARQMTWRPVFSSAVFALRADAPLWEQWRRVMTDGLTRSADRALSQCALNVAIATSAAGAHPLPQWVNWPCQLAVPMFDRASGLLVEPEIPFEPLSIVHLGSRRNDQLTLSTTDGGSISTRVDYSSVRNLRQ
ncbi:hypothetical protein BH09PLA1_BH09PLA1_19000 [soil metagenome]